MQVSCRSGERKSVDKFFVKVLAVAKENSKIWSKALAAVLKELDARAGERTNLYMTCARTLRSTIAQQRIVCCPDDLDLQHLKLMYAQYFYGFLMQIEKGIGRGATNDVLQFRKQKYF